MLNDASNTSLYGTFVSFLKKHTQYLSLGKIVFINWSNDKTICAICKQKQKSKSLLGKIPDVIGLWASWNLKLESKQKWFVDATGKTRDPL